MARTDRYVVATLPQWTGMDSPVLHWRESDDQGYWAECNGVRILLGFNYSRGGTRRVIQLAHSEALTSIVEPVNTSLFSRRWKNDDDRALAEAIGQLFAAAASQVSARQDRIDAHTAEVRETLFRQLVFGDPPG